MKNPIHLLISALLAAILFWGCDSLGKSDSTVSPQTGTGGSLARFAITGNSLYIVNGTTLGVYDISSPGDPKNAGSRHLGFGIETVYPYRDHLFIGASDGMYIFDNSNPLDPLLLTKYWHMQSCDPVVVQDQYAYVTLRSGTTCRTGISTSSLDVVDISDISSPKMIHTQSMRTPYGLGVSGNHLFVCDGDNGLKMYSISNPAVPELKKSYNDVPAYDVIVRNANALIVTGRNGLYQYSFSDDSENLQLLSRIPVL